MLQAHSRKAAMVIGPALAAALAVLLEPALTAWAKEREAILPLIVFTVLASMLHPRLRHLLVITLCYGVSFLALRDSFRIRQTPLPLLLDYDLVDQCRPALLWMVAGLSATAAVVEAVQPGTVWARRCYFGAAALYFTGQGLITYAWHGSWQSVMLLVTGITAVFGCLFAHRIVASEMEAEEEAVVSDEISQQQRETKHQLALRRKEWHESLPAGDNAERETNAPMIAP